MCYEENCKHGIYCRCKDCERFIENEFDNLMNEPEIDEREKNNKD